MKLIVGLGNPGEKYAKTRHNVGFMLLDVLAKAMNDDHWEFSKKFKSLIIHRHPIALLVKPQAFMNNSGNIVKRLINYYKINVGDLWIIHDDMDIKLDHYKIQQGHGPRLHNGVNSVEKALMSEAFWRVRVGVDNRIEDIAQRTKGEPSFTKAMEGKEYVLQNFEKAEREIIDRVINKLTIDLINLISK